MFRYDRAETPPPGVGLASAAAHTAVAKALHFGTAAALAAGEARSRARRSLEGAGNGAAPCVPALR